MDADITAKIFHLSGDLGPGQIGPDQRLLGGTAGGVVGEGFTEVFVDLWILVDPPLPTGQSQPPERTRKVLLFVTVLP